MIKHIPVYGDFVVKTGRPYYFIKLLAKQWDKYRKDLARISNPEFKEIETYTHGRELLIGPNFQISPIQYSIEFIKSKPLHASNALFQNIRRSRQAAVFTDPRTASKVQDTVIGKDNFSLISFNRFTVTNRIWYASGQFDAFDKNEANRLLFPYAEHSINLISQGAAAEEPVNIMMKQTNTRLGERNRVDGGDGVLLNRLCFSLYILLNGSNIYSKSVSCFLFVIAFQVERDLDRCFRDTVLEFPPIFPGK